MKSEGQITTFYSYKGGTGRSMALANVAVLLARWGYRVLMVDWDLEAPGLEFFFRSSIEDPTTVLERDGVIELLLGNRPAGRKSRGAKSWKKMVVDIRLAEGNTLHLITAGNRAREYFRRVTDLSVERFYAEDGGLLVESLREEWKLEYDFTLVDSRTGVTDIGGICTIQLPDYLVLLFTPTDQALDGILDVASRVCAAQQQLTVDRQKLVVIPVLSRVDVQQEFVLLQDWMKKCAARLGEIYRDWLPSSVEPGKMLEATKLPYIPFYSFAEKLAVIEEKMGSSTILGLAYENLAALIANRLEPSRALLDDRDHFVRLALERKRIGSREFKRILVCYSHKDSSWKDRIASHLGPFLRQGVLEFWDDTRIEVGADWAAEIEESVNRADVILLLVSADFLASPFVSKVELAMLLRRRVTEGVRVIPVILRASAWSQISWLKNFRVLPMDGKPLASLAEDKADTVLAALAEEVSTLTAISADDSESVGFNVPYPTQISPTRLSPGADHLFGRELELSALDEAWNDPLQHVLSIVAFGGVGKTSLVREWMARQSAKNWEGFDRVFDWSFFSQGSSERGTSSADTFIAEGLKFFGDNAMAQGAASAWDKGARLAQLVANQRTLLVLDGVEPLQRPPGPLAGELKDPALATLLKGLAQLNPGLCIVTTRERVSELAPFRDTTAPEWVLHHLSTPAGVELLKTLGVRGTATEFQQVVEEVKGHALTLDLLGRYLAKAHGGDIRKRDQVKFKKADGKTQAGYSFETIGAYEEWLTRGGEEGTRQLAVLRLIGLFDRPADAGCLVALRESPAISGLTDVIVALSDAQWNLCLSKLEECGLISRTAADEVETRNSKLKTNVDAHPLIREYFAKQLRENNPEAWSSAHLRLYEYLKNSAEDKPEPTLENLQPLYQAVAHGCKAGIQQRVYDEVYWKRIQRGQEGYATRMLGAISANLDAQACFFEPPWSQISPKLCEADQAWMLNEAAFCLRALGRLTEASEPMRAGLVMSVLQEAWTRAAINARNLSELELTLGEVPAAVVDAEQSVAYANRSGDAIQQLGNLTTLAEALYQGGRHSDALAHFQKAEAMQRERQPEFPLLYSVPGFRYCDLLLETAEREVWRRVTKTEVLDPKSKEICHIVETRAAQTLKWGDLAYQQSLLEIALGHLTLARAMLFASILDSSLIDRRLTAIENLKAAVDSLRRSARSYELPRGLFTRALVRFLEGKYIGPESAQADLDEAWEIAERGPMRLFMADIHLYRARLFGPVSGKMTSEAERIEYPWNKNPDGSPRGPLDDLAAARKLIEQCGYWRRKEEIEDAEEASKNW